MSTTAVDFGNKRVVARVRRRPPFSLTLAASLLGAAVVLPVIYLAIRTFEAGSETLADILFRPRVAAIILRSFVLVAIVSAASAVLALALGWLIERTDLPFRRLWSIVTVLPLVIPSYIMAFLFISVFAPRGMVQRIFAEPFGIQEIPSFYGLPGAAIVLILVSYPYTLLTVRAALRGSGRALEEASRTLGKGPWETFFRVTLPQLRPAIASGSLLVALYTISDFGAVSLLRFETFTWAIYVQYTSYVDRTAAAALSIVLVGFAIVIFLATTRVHGEQAFEETHQAELGGADQSSTPLGRWKYPALALCSLTTFVALVIPMAVLLFWLIRGVSAGEELGIVWGAAINSAVVSGSAATVAVVAALPVVVLAVRYPGFFSSAIDRVSHMGFALPGLVIALALVFFGSRLVPALYQTHAMLVFAYLVLFLPVAMGPLRSSLLQVNPRVEEAGRTLGKRPLQVFSTITIPLLRPGILAGGALVFLTAMKELPATLLLSPLDFGNLATRVWAASSEAFFAQAALPALLLVVISAIPMMFLIGRRRTAQA
ncbi:MAG: iron ABC transporter permease [Dehalococcoidia bacterium]|nr:iron ABC transporter permease [Dehalococcoidia bacterium]